MNIGPLNYRSSGAPGVATYLYEQALLLASQNNTRQYNYRNIICKERIINTDQYCLGKPTTKRVHIG